MNQLVINLVVAMVLTGGIALTYFFTHKGKLNNEMFLTILILPLVVAMIIYTIGSNVAGAFSLSGIFSIVRFRSEQASFKDITYILFCVAIGLASATGFYFEGLIFTIIAIIVLLGFYFKSNTTIQAQLDITIAEGMQNSNEINKIIDKYCKSRNMKTVRTRDLGSLYEYKYMITYNEGLDLQDMIDELRIINSNLPIKVVA